MEEVQNIEEEDEITEEFFKNGIFVTVEGNILHRWKWNGGKMTQLEDSTFADELMNESEYDNYLYEKFCDKLEGIIKTDENGNLIGVTREATAKVLNIALEAALVIRENDFIAGHLIFTDIANGAAKPEETLEYYSELIKHTYSSFREPIYFNQLMRYILDKNEEYDSPEEWYEQCVLKEEELFNRTYQVEIVHCESGFVNQYFFTCYSDYYAFMLLHFAAEKRRIVHCRCCGAYFLPKNKKNTLYCDRIHPDYGKTCKKLAPKLRMKLNRNTDPLLAEYDRIKNRNYRRAERTYLKENIVSNEKSMTFEQYETWYRHVSIARKLYLLGKLNAEQFHKIIQE